MFENIANFFKKLIKSETKEAHSKDTAKERLHLVLMQDRANVSADFLELMKQEIIEVIKKYIEVEESAIDVRLTNEIGEDGTTGAPSLYANIPIVNIKNNIKKEIGDNKQEDKDETSKETKKEQEDEKQKEEIKENKQEEDEQNDKKEELEESNIEETKQEDKSETIEEVVKVDEPSDSQNKKEENKNTTNKKSTNKKSTKKNK